MTTAYLVGNGAPCDACALRREWMDRGAVLRPATPCNVCGGVGFVPLPDAEIIKRACDEARRLYWPLFDAKIRGAA